MGRCRGRQGLHLSKVTPNASLWQSTWWTLLAPDITRRRGLGSKQIYTQKQADFKGDRLTHMLVEEFPSIQTESWVWIKGVKWIQFIKQKVRKFILEKKPVEIGFHIFVFTCNITWILWNNCCCSVAQSCLTLCDPMDCSTPGFPVLHCFPEVAQTHVHRVSDAIQPSRPLSHLLLLPSLFPSIRIFSSGSLSVLHLRWPKYWNFSFSISPSIEYLGLISSRMDWLDFLAVQETLKSLLQHGSSKASILWCLAFFMVQLSHPYMTTGKAIALIIWTIARKVMSLLFNMLFRLVITFLPRSKHLLISLVQSFWSPPK